jgi:beta-phosphoglucomutase-like phosphatase (HAD superfamily)
VQLNIQVPILPGCERLTAHLTACGIPYGIATSSSRETFGWKMTNHKEWLKGFKAVVTGDDVTKGKPDPEIFEKVCEQQRDKCAATRVCSDCFAGCRRTRRRTLPGRARGVHSPPCLRTCDVRSH